MRRSYFHFVTLFRIPININYSWFIILGLVIFSLATGYFPSTNPELDIYAHWLMGFIASLLLFASLLAHELAHSLVAKHYNLPINGITLFVFGGVAHLEREPDTPGVELKMAIAGPALSGLLALLLFFLSLLLIKLSAPTFVLAIINYLILLNLVVGLANLIPGFPLDGGRIFRALIWTVTGNFKTATSIASYIGKMFACLLIGLGIFALWNALLLNGIWFIFLGLFLYEAAEISYLNATVRRRKFLWHKAY